MKKNKYISFLNWIWDIMYMNLLFIIFALPIFTIASSYLALTNVVNKRISGESIAISREFYCQFKRNFIKGFILEVVMLILLLGIMLNLNLSDSIKKYSFLLKLINYLALFLITSTSLYIFPLLSIFDYDIYKGLKLGFILAIGRLPYTLLMIIVIIIPIYISIERPYRFLSFFIVIGFSMQNLLLNILFNKSIKKCSKNA